MMVRETGLSNDFATCLKRRKSALAKKILRTQLFSTGTSEGKKRLSKRVEIRIELPITIGSSRQ